MTVTDAGSTPTATVLAGVAVAAALPYTPLAGPLGFTALPLPFLLTVAVLVLCYLALVEAAKRLLLNPRELLRPYGGPARYRVGGCTAGRPGSPRASGWRQGLPPSRVVRPCRPVAR
jgi:hypothetical protein